MELAGYSAGEQKPRCLVPGRWVNTGRLEINFHGDELAGHATNGILRN